MEQSVELLFVSVSYLGLIERNKRSPSLSLLSKMCAVYGVTSDYLLFGKGAKRVQTAEYALEILSEEQYAVIIKIVNYVNHYNFKQCQLDFLLSSVQLLSDYEISCANHAK